MKRTSHHAFEPEEIMAYLDGELPAREAAELASHLEHCEECQSLARQLRQVSERMLDFQVEACPARVDEAVLRAEDNRLEPAVRRGFEWKARRRRTFRAMAWAGGFAVILLIVAILVVPRMFEEKRVAVAPPVSAVADRVSPFGPPSNAPAPPQPGPITAMAQSESGIAGNAGTLGNFKALTRRGIVTLSAGANQATTEVQQPMIVQTASVTILASNYDQASKAVEQIARQHGGYAESLSADSRTGVARSLSATLRVPEKQLDACLAGLRKLGHVEQEWRNNREVTGQYIDLTARLKNARAEEQRIIQLLATRTGKLSDVLDAEQELARVRGEIESMDSQRAYIEHQVSYATVQLQLNEEYRAQLNSGAVSTGTRIRNALVEGFRNLGDGAVGIVLFVFAYGPSILFWLALIGLPSWFVWRRFKARRERAR